MFKDITFAYPWVLYFLPLVLLLGAAYWFIGRKRQPSVTYSSLKILSEVPVTWRERFHNIPVLFRLFALGALIVALARPQSFSSGENIYLRRY